MLTVTIGKYKFPFDSPEAQFGARKPNVSKESDPQAEKV